jgi:site-specific recombinase XerD
MKHSEKSAFIISEFGNPSGQIVFRVSGWLEGTRVRKNFATRKEAEAERQLLDIQRLQSDTGIRVAATRLDDAQLREAEALFQRVEGRTRPLSFYVDFGLENYREPERQKSLAEAVAAYIAAKEHEFEQDHLSTPQIQRIRMDLKKLLRHFPRKAVADLNVANLVSFLELGRTSLKTYNNRRGIIGTFLKFCFHRGWIAENPVPKVPQHRIRRRLGMATTFTAAEARTLMEFIEGYDQGRWVPYFALCLFAGIRPGVPHGEITKLQPDAVNLETGIISISAMVSKVREPRRIAIQPNLAAWLRAYPLDQFPIILGNFKKRRERFKDKVHLTHDVLRHTFISMYVAKFRSIGEAAIQAGNSESIIRRHYLDLKTTAEAEEFWSILPKSRTVAANPPHAKPQSAKGPAQIIQQETAA